MTPLEYWQGWIELGVLFLAGLFVVMVAAGLTLDWIRGRQG